MSFLYNMWVTLLGRCRRERTYAIYGCDRHGDVIRVCLPFMDGYKMATAYDPSQGFSPQWCSLYGIPYTFNAHICSNQSQCEYLIIGMQTCRGDIVTKYILWEQWFKRHDFDHAWLSQIDPIPLPTMSAQM